MIIRRWSALLTSLVLPGLWPRADVAACSMTDVGGCVDEAQYSMLYGVAVPLWGIDRTLLQLAYQLDQLRWWIVTQAFTSAYAAIRAVAEPLLTPVGMLAVVVGMLLFLLVPLFGRITLVNIRQALIWLVVAPLLLSEAGLWFVQLEELRGDVGGVLSGQVGALSAQGLFGVPASDPENPMPAPQPLYPAAAGGSACAAGSVARPQRIGAGEAPDSLRMDDLAAALLLANAQDIHCPGEGAPAYDLPDGFFADGGVFATATDDFRGMDAAQRARAIRRLQNGITRLLLGMVACVLAVLETLIQLVFSLSLVVLWLSLPLIAVLLLFSPSMRPLGLVLQRVVSVVISSWIVSLLLGLLTACLAGAAATGNPTAVIALSAGGVLLAGRLLRTALTTLTDSLDGWGGLLGGAIGDAVAGTSVGVANLAERVVRQTVKAGGDAAAVAGSAAAGSVGAAATAAMAYRATGSGRYAAGAAIGRIRPVAQVGAVAASMGLIEEEFGAGLYAGERAARSGLGAFARQLQSDARRPLADGQTVGRHAARRSIARQLRQAQQPTLLERAEHALAYVTGADQHAAGDSLIAGVQQSRDAIARRALGQAGAAAIRLAADPIEAGQGVAHQVSGAIRAYRTRDLARRPPARRGMAVRRAPIGATLQWLPRQVPPADAETLPIAAVDRVALLEQGATIQENPSEDTLTFWQTQQPESGGHPAERRRLPRRTALIQPDGPEPPAVPNAVPSTPVVDLSATMLEPRAAPTRLTTASAGDARPSVPTAPGGALSRRPRRMRAPVAQPTPEAIQIPIPLPAEPAARHSLATPEPTGMPTTRRVRRTPR